MSYLNFISDQDLINCVSSLIAKAETKKNQADRDFRKNVIDPFSAVFEACSYSNYEDWRDFEKRRQFQKTLQMNVGNLHQSILGSVEGWKNLGTGNIFDLVSEEQGIIAEVKNKHNTVKGSDLIGVYDSLAQAITRKHSQFKDYTGYFVQIIPKSATRYNNFFTPSDKDTGTRRPVNEKIKVIDGASFYHLVTGEENALKSTFKVLPSIIEQVYREQFDKENFSIQDLRKYQEYFDLAYK